MVTAEQVGDAVIATLRRWLPDYLGEMERRRGSGPASLPLPGSYQLVADLEQLVARATPMVAIVLPGTSEITQQAGTRHAARWVTSAVAIVPADTADKASRLAMVYAATMRWALVQQGTLDGFAVATDWGEEEYLPLDLPDKRNVAAGRFEGEVEVADVLDAWAGPSEPSANPATPPIGIEIDRVEVEVVKAPLLG